MILGTLPFIADGFPRAWPKTIDSVAKLEFDHVMPGHGPAQHDRRPMTNERNYIEELAERVAAGKKAGKDHTEPNLNARGRVRSGVKTNITDVFRTSTGSEPQNYSTVRRA